MSVPIERSRTHLPDARQWERRYQPTERGGGFGTSETSLLVGGLALLGLGALAWYYLWPDVRRYIKLSNM